MVYTPPVCTAFARNEAARLDDEDIAMTGLPHGWQPVFSVAPEAATECLIHRCRMLPYTPETREERAGHEQRFGGAQG